MRFLWCWLYGDVCAVESVSGKYAAPQASERTVSTTSRFRKVRCCFRPEFGHPPFAPCFAPLDVAWFSVKSEQLIEHHANNCRAEMWKSTTVLGETAPTA
jgi:hypothetical protein